MFMERKFATTNLEMPTIDWASYIRNLNHNFSTGHDPQIDNCTIALTLSCTPHTAYTHTMPRTQARTCKSTTVSVAIECVKSACSLLRINSEIFIALRVCSKQSYNQKHKQTPLWAHKHKIACIRSILLSDVSALFCFIKRDSRCYPSLIFGLGAILTVSQPASQPVTCTQSRTPHFSFVLRSHFDCHTIVPSLNTHLIACGFICHFLVCVYATNCFPTEFAILLTLDGCACVCVSVCVRGARFFPLALGSFTTSLLFHCASFFYCHRNELNTRQLTHTRDDSLLVISFACCLASLHPFGFSCALFSRLSLSGAFSRGPRRAARRLGCCVKQLCDM